MANINELKNLGQTAFRNGRIAEALEHYLNASRKAPKDAETWHMLSVLHGMSGNASEAEVCCRKTISLQPNAASAYNNLGTILKNKGRLDEAAAAYRKSLALAPNNAAAANNLGTLLRETGNRDGALAHYDTAIRLKPDYADAYSNRGAVLQDMGRIAEALQSYQRAVQLQPNNPAGYFNLACGCREAGRMEDAEGAFRYAAQLDPNNARTWDGLSHVQLELRRFAEARTSALRAIELDRSLVDAYLHVAAAFRGLRQDDKAAEYFRRALQIDPHNETASYFLAVMGVDEAPDQSPADYVVKLFDNYAATFDDSLVNRLEYRTPSLLHRLALQHLNTDSSKVDVIDLGCGTGLCGPLFRPLARRLVGVDLSAKMVARAQERQVYDHLVVDDLIPPLQTAPAGFDLALAADVFVYIGNLGPVFAATHTALRGGGLFLFSTERNDTAQAFTLRSSGRYAHSKDYVAETAAAYNFAIVTIEDVTLRKDDGKDILGNLYVLKRS